MGVSSSTPKPNHKSADTVVVYNMNSLFRSSQRLLIFVSEVTTSGINSLVKSATNLYPNAHWLEREVLEMFNYKFALKRDTRNLLLQYGDSSAPFLKSFPTVGVRELFYNPMRDSVDQRSTSLQN
jgi:NADH-quinone oxidoreductase subunit C